MKQIIEAIIIYIGLVLFIVIGCITTGLFVLISGMGLIALSPIVAWIWYKKMTKPITRIRKQHGKD